MNNQLTKRRAHFFAAAAFSVLFMLLFAFLIPGVKASADQSFTAPCTGRTISYSKSGVTYVSSSSFVTVKCNGVSGGVSQFTITVSPNTTAYSRSATLYAKKGTNGATVEKIYITQSAVQTKSYSASYMGGTYTSPLNCSYVSNNTAVCNSGSGSSFYVKPNTTTSQRKCTLTLKTNAGIVYYLYITQAPVPIVTKSIAGGGGTFSRSYSYSASLTPNKANMISVSSSSPSGGTYTYNISVSANPSSSATRTTDITVKTSSGVYLEIIRVTQSRFVAPTTSESYNSDPRTVTFTCPGATFNKTTYSNTAMFSTGTSLGNGKYQFKIPQNKSTSPRSNTVTFRDQYGTPIAKYTVTQAGVPLYQTEVDDGCPTIEFYYKSGVETFTYDTKYVTNISKTGNGKFVITITANPSTTASRTFSIIAKNSSGVYVEIIRLTQPPHDHYYVYTTSNHVYSRTCLYCNDKDTSISYQEYISKGYKNLDDSVKSVKSYMKALGYSEDSQVSKNMVDAYKYIKNCRKIPPLETMEEFQSGMQNLKAITDGIASFTNFNSTVSNTTTIVNTINHLQMFFLQDNPADKIGNAVKLAGDLLSTDIAGKFTGDYLSSALDTVGDALKVTIRLVAKEQARKLAYALEGDSKAGEYIVGTPVSQINKDQLKKTIKSLFTDDKGRSTITDKQADEYVEQVLRWKVGHRLAITMSQTYDLMGYNIGYPSNNFWTYVNNYISTCL